MHPGHHALCEYRGWRVPRKVLQLPNQRARSIQLGTALLTPAHMRLERSRTESDLAIEEQVDLGRKQMSIHVILQADLRRPN